MRGNGKIAGDEQRRRAFSATMVFNRSSTWVWTVTSSPLVASSEITSLGEQASAMAITTRCAMPPVSSCG